MSLILSEKKTCKCFRKFLERNVSREGQGEISVGKATLPMNCLETAWSCLLVVQSQIKSGFNYWPASIASALPLLPVTGRNYTDLFNLTETIVSMPTVLVILLNTVCQVSCDLSYALFDLWLLGLVSPYTDVSFPPVAITMTSLGALRSRRRAGYQGNWSGSSH